MVLPTLVPDDNSVELVGDPDLDVSIVHGDDTVEMIPGEYFFFAIFFLSFILQGHLHQLLLGEGKGSGTILQRLEVPGKDDWTRALGRAMCQPWWRGTCLRSFPAVVRSQKLWFVQNVMRRFPGVHLCITGPEFVNIAEFKIVIFIIQD